MPASGQILTAAQMRLAEDALIAGGETVETLMERAGRGAADWAYRMAAGRKVTVLCGPGNNGGDGYVIARVLAERGVPVKVVAPLPPATDAARHARTLWGGEPGVHAEGHVLVDCLFGTGLSRPLTREMSDLLHGHAATHDLRIAVDLPSGVESDTGEILKHVPPHFDLTLALGAWKRAHWLMPTRLMGARRLVPIGIGAVEGAAQLADRPRLDVPAPLAHKYNRGLLAVVAGEMPGATLLAARAAQHGGAGYVRLLADTRPSGVPDDLVVDTRPLEEALDDRRIGAVLVGPGLGRSDEALRRLRICLQHRNSLLLDADALVLLDPAMRAQSLAQLTVTPHDGELASLAQTFGIAGGNRVEMAIELAKALNARVLAKGPVTLLAHPDAPLKIFPPATSWLSTAGTGDVLAGLVASRLAMASPSCEPQAEIEGFHLHAEAARLAGPAFSASQLIDHIPAAYRVFL